ncbi:MAG: hypothetical protein Q7S33_01775 [Nanoarchaeota archaeon]|nr:hypothetical protein [Nanoarchaeota archaeon]
MKITIKMWIMITCILLAIISIFSIPPTFMEKGVLVKSVDKNSSIFEKGLRSGEIITQINNQKIDTLADYSKSMEIFADNQTHRLEITTKSNSIIDLFSPLIIQDIEVTNIPKTKIKTGLDLQGGARALITAETPLTDSELDDLISVSQERLNIYGLSDVSLKKVSDLSGNKYMLVEIAGSSPSDLQDLIAKQGKFEAKIGNETAFVGGSKDLTYVGRTGQDAGVYECSQIQDGSYYCNFRFVIYLSEEAAQRHADITSKLGVNLSSGGQYLDKKIDFYLDDKLTQSLNIGYDLKGKVTTQIQISGSGTGQTRQEAVNDAQIEMKKLQTILITGSLPFKLKVEKIDKISPMLGDQFEKTILTAALLVILSVALVIFVRYRKITISLTIIFTVISEIVIVLGVAALIRWNMDLASIAGIIASIGTGVDDQIVIVDESRRNKQESLKKRIKTALFIIFTAYATAVVSLLPLYWAGAGLLKGFAVTSLIGITAGVFITRPAFADIARQLEEKYEEKK